MSIWQTVKLWFTNFKMFKENSIPNSQIFPLIQFQVPPSSQSWIRSAMSRIRRRIKSERNHLSNGLVRQHRILGSVGSVDRKRQFRDGRIGFGRNGRHPQLGRVPRLLRSHLAPKEDIPVLKGSHPLWNLPGKSVFRSGNIDGHL